MIRDQPHSHLGDSDRAWRLRDLADTWPTRELADAWQQCVKRQIAAADPCRQLRDV